MVSRSVNFGPRARRALNDILGGGAASVLSITFGLSYALLIFAGPLAPYLSYGVAATFITSAVLAAVLALGSSMPFAIGGPESSTAAITGILAASLVERMAATDPTAPLLAPTLITLGFSTIVTGIVLCGFGVTRMGRAIRYVPYPVVGGFLGATGLLIVLGAIRVITGHQLQFATLDRFANIVTLSELSAACAMALILNLTWHRSRHSLGLPADSDRRRDRRASRVLDLRHLARRGAGLGLDLSAATADPVHAAVERRRNPPLSLVRPAGSAR